MGRAHDQVAVPGLCAHHRARRRDRPRRRPPPRRGGRGSDALRLPEARALIGRIRGPSVVETSRRVARVPAVLRRFALAVLAMALAGGLLALALPVPERAAPAPAPIDAEEHARSVAALAPRRTPPVVAVLGQN